MSFLIYWLQYYVISDTFVATSFLLKEGKIMQKKESAFPIIYGVISAIISFIAVIFICQRSFRLNLQLSIIIAGVFAIFFFCLSYFRGHASVEIKRIVYEYKLTDQQLAKITGMKASDFPIYQNRLQLILPKRYWPRVLDALQKYEKQQQAKE
ncbi:MAG: hypothetical protein LKU_02098 [Lactobacillus kefiranofaciens]|nr:Hypothetical protein WANG_1316 [Lactobacillus kefiranofaciens subsp. kefiranofaciens]KRL30904.1 hypothetical protein FC94_GL002034 [Lactobacillus kefiranofaciens subsp. kefirgranum DSM 10550 = JCM 8572]KRM20795.1 hypothetical protein FC93_GL001197 [Lactobacillus kefiranofaciens subsp. kefiranofaciens DSM 5016 = JCM 6985]